MMVSIRKSCLGHNVDPGKVITPNFIAFALFVLVQSLSQFEVMTCGLYTLREYLRWRPVLSELEQ